MSSLLYTPAVVYEKIVSEDLDTRSYMIDKQVSLQSSKELSGVLGGDSHYPGGLSKEVFQERVLFPREEKGVLVV
jgi:hypothetical protein